MPHIIEQSANRLPDKQAFRFGDSFLTYEDLVQKANQIAKLLADFGVKKGDRVGIYLKRSLEIPISIYGIMKAGAAYVPLDPFSPPARTQFLIEDCGIRHLISNPDLKSRLYKVLEKDLNLDCIIGLEEDLKYPKVSWEELEQLPSNSLDIRILEKDLAYVMYTSGSTGNPKGIMHTHYSGLNYAKLSADLYDVNEQDRIGNHCALHYDISTFGYFSAPLKGATTTIISDAHTKLPASLTQLVENEKLTIWYSVPLALIQMLQKGILHKRKMSSLRWVLFGGEPFSTKHLRTLMKMWPNARFSNVYGPAEVNQCTFYHIPTIPENDDPIPLGQVWNNTEMLILNKNENPVRTNEIGELLIRTGTMMKGYWKRPDLTKKSFFKRYTTPGFEEIFYRTGDLVMQKSNGDLMFMGRKDRQIKTRGYRVELDEIEHLMNAHEFVNEAVVLPIPNGDEGWLIKAIVHLKPNGNLREEELKKYLGNNLPEYAIPNKISFVKCIPRTPAGKIDRLAIKSSLSNLEIE